MSIYFTTTGDRIPSLCSERYDFTEQAEMAAHQINKYFDFRFSEQTVAQMAEIITRVYKNRDHPQGVSVAIK